MIRLLRLSALVLLVAMSVAIHDSPAPTKADYIPAICVGWVMFCILLAVTEAIKPYTPRKSDPFRGLRFWLWATGGHKDERRRKGLKDFTRNEIKSGQYSPKWKRLGP